MVFKKWLPGFLRFAVIVIIPILIGCDTKKVTGSQPEPGEIKVLFIGSSYFSYNNLPGLFTALAGVNDKEVFVDYRIIDGKFLNYHAFSPVTLDKIKEQNWDFVVIQGVGRQMAYPDVFTDHPSYLALKELKKRISANSKSTKMMFCLPWAFEDGMVWMDGWTDLYDDMQEKIYTNTLAYAEDIGFVIAPVGMAWYRILEEKNYPLHYLHLSDWNHPSVKGSYVMACVIYSAIFKESTEGEEYDTSFPKEEALYFQEVASRTVLDSLELWHLE